MHYWLASIACAGLLLSALPACGQGFQGNQYGRVSDPNMGHFYMARQQIQILDDAPSVNDLRTMPQPGAAQQMRGPAPLPKAGFNAYSQSAMMPSMSNSLPKVVNGVPPKPVAAPAPGINAQLAKAGKYKAPRPAAAPVATTAKTYAPYKGYGRPSSVPASPVGYSAPYSGSATKVSGSLLHWSRTGH